VRVRDVVLLLGSSHAAGNGSGRGGEEGRGAERSGGGRRRGGDGPTALDAAAAVQDLELRIAEDERVAGPHSLEPIEAVAEAGEVREEVPLDDALDGGDVGVLVEHLRPAALRRGGGGGGGGGGGRGGRARGGGCGSLRRREAAGRIARRAEHRGGGDGTRVTDGSRPIGGSEKGKVEALCFALSIVFFVGVYYAASARALTI